ncbi:MAG: hypothetical protein LBV04_06810, partial [Deferribacteraceae bacterium]|nr:hypothetical protein [Deferribacteraceae bacterium]
NPMGNTPPLDLFWIAAQGRNDVCCHPLRSEWVLAFHDKSIARLMRCQSSVPNNCRPEATIILNPRLLRRASQ